MSTTGDDTASGSEEITSSKKECTSCEQNNIDTITKGIDSVVLDSITLSMCAACGKKSNSNDMNTCNKCKSVKYCNAACKKKHRKKHKKACERRVAELHDEALFKEVDPKECPICMLPLPDASLTTTVSCCGKRICIGCLYAMKMSEGKDLCAFCRTPYATSGEEEIKRTKSLIDNENGEGYLMLASYYDQGHRGLQQDLQKANELLLKAGELGCANGYYNLGNHYDNGRGVERDKKKAQHYWELAAMGGDINARHNLGCMEGKADNFHRAMKHFMIAARAGHEKSLELVQKGFIGGFVTIDEYVNTELAYTKIHEEIKSDERDIVAEAAKARLLGR